MPPPTVTLALCCGGDSPRSGCSQHAHENLQLGQERSRSVPCRRKGRQRVITRCQVDNTQWHCQLPLAGGKYCGLSARRSTREMSRGWRDEGHKVQQAHLFTEEFSAMQR